MWLYGRVAGKDYLHQFGQKIGVLYVGGAAHEYDDDSGDLLYRFLTNRLRQDCGHTPAIDDTDKTPA